jgi:Tol biopolymer transport system component
METGTVLGVYEISEKLGAGGMGEVYLAHDSRLGRDVAIKVLPAALAADGDRVARLEREARVLASLDHPNIATIFGLEDGDGVRFLVMQLVRGSSLDERMAGKALPIDEALDIARQVAEGMEAAHELGVVHRDLKPGNVMVTPGGEVKILDFGLAKALGADSSGDARATDLTASPTMLDATSVGTILGTAPYMSPEQARGRALDRRSDIWSFGAVLYEMLTGVRAFEGETVTDVLAAVITRDPDWSLLPESLPGNVKALLRRCLEQDPRQRLRDIGEARIVLSAPGDAPTPVEEATPAAAGPGSRWGWIAATAAGVAAAVLAWQLWMSPARSSAPSYVAIREFGIQVAAEKEAREVAVSPDGRAIAIAGYDEEGRGIWVRHLHEPTARRLAGAQGYGLAWSHDGQQLAFVDADRLQVHDLRTDATATRYEAAGARLTAESGTLGGIAWAADGHIVFIENLGRGFNLREVDAAGEVRTLTTGAKSATNHLALHIVDDGTYMLSGWTSAHGHVDTALVYADGRMSEPFLHLDAAVVWVPPDIVLFARDNALWAQRLDVERATLRGEAVALLTEIDTAPGSTPWLSVGGDTLSYRTGVGSELPTALEWVDRQGQLIERVGERANYYDPRIAPDGRSFVVDISNEGDAGDLWLIEPNGRSSRLTSSVADETRPTWSPDGSRIVLETTREAEPGKLYFKDVSATASDPVNIDADPRIEEPTDWVGDTIVGNSANLSTIWIFDTSTGQARPFRETPFADSAAALSPDGTHVAYVSNETGQPEIWVETFPETGPRRRLSLNGGTTPVWRRDGREIVFWGFDGTLMSVAVSAESPPQFADPEPLFEASLRAHEIRQFDVTADGERFLLNRLLENPELPIRLLLGWQQELLQRAGPGW